MVEVKLTGKPMEDRLADRLRNSGDAAHADTVVQQGSSPLRTFAAMTAGLPSITPATILRCANGSLPMPTVATCTIKA